MAIKGLAKAVKFIRRRGRIIPIVQKVVQKRSAVKRKNLRAISSARTNLSNKRIGAIKAVREAKIKRKKAKELVYALERKNMELSKVSGSVQRSQDIIVNQAEKQLMSGKKLRKITSKMLLKRKGKGQWVDIDDINDVYTEEQIKRMVRNRAYRQAQNNPKYKQLEKLRRDLNSKYNRNENLTRNIENKVIPYGVTAKATVVNDKVVKIDSDRFDMISAGDHLNMEERAKTAIILAKKKLTPETFLVKTSKNSYSVQEKLKLPLFKGAPSFQKTENAIKKLDDRLMYGEGIVTNDTRFENVGFKGKKLMSIDVGDFESTPDLRVNGKYAKRLNKFIIQSNKRRK
jgi:hypothetical protein